MAGKRVLLIVNGTRGDCQPFAALALALQKSGFDAVILTNPDHETLCRDLGVEFRSNGFPMRELFTSDAAVAAFKSNNIVSFLSVNGAQHRKHGTKCYRALYECMSAYQPDLVICGTQHNPDSPWIPRLFRVPVLNFVLANSHTQAATHAPYGLPSLPLGLNRPVWWLVFWKYISDMSAGGWAVLAELSARSSADFLPSVREVLDTLGAGDRYSFVPYVICQDEWLTGRLPTDKHWFRYIGNLTLPEKALTGDEFGAAQESLLREFLGRAGPDPRPLVYIGWGSVQGETQEWMACLAVRTLMLVGCRGIVLGGWEQLSSKHLLGQPDSPEMEHFVKEHVLFLPTANHAQLFRKCSVIVHHGGIGTTISAIRSGTPSVVTPIFYDQFDSARLVQKSGQGIGLRAFSSTTPETLAAAIRTCLDDHCLRAAARELGERLCARDGCEEAVELVSDFLRPSSMSAYWQHMDALEGREALARRKRRCAAMAMKIVAAVAAAVVVVAATVMGWAR